MRRRRDGADAAVSAGLAAGIVTVAGYLPVAPGGQRIPDNPQQDPATPPGALVRSVEPSALGAREGVQLSYGAGSPDLETT